MSAETLTLSNLGRFYLPLGFTSVIMATSHWVISIGLARTAEPEVALSSYAVGMSTLALFEMAAVMLRPATVALVRTKDDARVVFKTALAILAALVGIPALLSLTPVLAWTYRRLLGVSPELLDPAVGVFRILLLLPLASGLRCFFQGLIIRERRTGVITLGMIVRLGVMMVTMGTLVTFKPHWGGAIGAITFLVGMCTEALIAFWHGRQTQVLRTPVSPSSDSHPETTVSSVLHFMFPLLISGMAANSGRMLLNAGLAREAVPAEVLAAFSVGWSLVWVIAAAVYGLHQTVLVFADGGDQQSVPAIRRFFVMMVIGCVLLICLLSFTPLAEIVLRQVMGTPERLVAGAAGAMRWLVLLPIVLAWQEWFTGHLLLQRCTNVLLWGKVINVIIVACAAGPCYPALAALGAGVGSVATLLGHCGEGILLTAASWRHRRLSVATFGEDYAKETDMPAATVD